MLVAAAVCPHPPLLVPALAAGAARELDALRDACDLAVGVLLAARPDLLVVVGSADVDGPFPATAWGSLAGYGVEVWVGSAQDGPPTLPLSLTVGRWLLDRQPGTVPRTLLFGVQPDTEPTRCEALGGGLAGRASRVAMLAMGDGSARRSRKGPGFLDERAEPFDDEVARVFGDGDAVGLLALDPARASELMVAGRAAWQVLAGAARAGTWSAQVHFTAAPYGVGYLVATWSPA